MINYKNSIHYSETIPVQRLVRETVSLLKSGSISPERAFAAIRFATDGSDDRDAWSQLARFLYNGIGCEKNEDQAVQALRRCGKVDWILSPAPSALWLNPEDELSILMDDDELYVERVDEDRLVDFFLDAEDDEDDARYACYNPANPGCNKDSPIVITHRDWFDEEEDALKRLLHPIPYRYVDYEVAKQELLRRDGRYLDHVTVRVCSHPLLTEDEDGERYLPKGKVLGYEEYWFEMPGSFSAFR